MNLEHFMFLCFHENIYK
uniref:Uncharacterized protein n=1 Tax=Anguilla anguilla TaxID=7936 RepID=A0A0E9PHS9_ANGAN